MSDRNLVNPGRALSDRLARQAKQMEGAVARIRYPGAARLEDSFGALTPVDDEWTTIVEIDLPAGGAMLFGGASLSAAGFSSTVDPLRADLRILDWQEARNTIWPSQSLVDPLADFQYIETSLAVDALTTSETEWTAQLQMRWLPGVVSVEYAFAFAQTLVAFPV